ILLFNEIRSVTGPKSVRLWDATVRSCELACHLLRLLKGANEFMASIGKDKPRPESAGQSGDDQGLSSLPEADSESVAELVEEGQYFEAGIVNAVENAPPADRKGKLKPREVQEDDVPPEYLDQDQERPKD